MFCYTSHLTRLFAPIPRRNALLAQELCKPAPGASAMHFDSKYPRNFMQQLSILIWKLNCVYWRSPSCEWQWRLTSRLNMDSMLGVNLCMGSGT